MIFSVTPNPALDLSGVVDCLIPNEKNYVHHEVRTPGGNAINAARILKKMRAPVVVGGFIGGGIGAEVQQLLEDEGIRHQFVRIRSNTRINVTVSNQETHLQTRLSFRGPKVKDSDREKLSQVISKMNEPSLLLIGGSLPPGLTPSHLAQIVRATQKRNIPVILDVPGKILKVCASANPFLVKPNLVEFQEWIGKSASSIGQVTQEAKKLLSRVPLICISSVEGGALMVTPQGAWFGETPKIQVRSTVGAGDSMVGAMTALLWKIKKVHQERFSVKSLPPGLSEELLRWGLASACATLSLPGLKLGNLKLINRFLPKIRSYKIG